VDARDKRGHDEQLNERFVQIIPVRVHRADEANLPGEGPMLAGCLALDRGVDFVEALRVNQPLQAVTLAKAIYQSFPMLASAPR
jgi:hypothetical protein